MLFFVHGFGFGHLYRDLPIMDKLAKMGSEVIPASYGKVLNELRTKFERTYEVPEIGNIELKDDGEISITGSIVENIKNIHPIAVGQIRNIIKEVKPDVVVADGYVISLPIARASRIPTVNIANCTNLWYVFSNNMPIISQGADMISKAFIDMSDKVIIPDYPIPFAITKNNVIYYNQRGKFHFVGPTVEYQRKNKKDLIFITMGGSEITTKLKLDISEEVVYSDGKMEYEEVLEYIGKAKAVITHGGHTTIMSSIQSKTPLLTIPLSEYKERVNNSKGVAEQGLGVYIPDEEISKEGIEMAIDYLNNPEIKKRLDMYSKWGGKLMGNKRAAELIYATRSKKM